MSGKRAGKTPSKVIPAKTSSVADLELAYDEFLVAKTNLDVAQGKHNEARRRLVETAKHCSIPLDRVVLMIEQDKYEDEEEEEEEEDDEEELEDRKGPWMMVSVDSNTNKVVSRLN